MRTTATETRERQTIPNTTKNYCKNSNLAKGGITVPTPPNSSFVLARWQHRTGDLAAVHVFNWGFDPQVSPSPAYITNVSLDQTSLPAKRHLNLSNGLSRGHECDRRQTDRQTTPLKNVQEQAESHDVQERFCLTIQHMLLLLLI